MPEAPLLIRGGQALVGAPSRFLNEIVRAAVRLSAPLARLLFTSAQPRAAAGEPRRAAIIALLMAEPGLDGSSSSARSTGTLHGTAAARMRAVSPLDLYRPRAATEDLRIPEQMRRSWAPDDLDHL